MFKKIEIHHWRQFEAIDIDIDDHITILTGSNGAGKTTLLGVLNQHFGWMPTLLSTPEREESTGTIKFFTGMWKSLFSKDDEKQDWLDVGKVHYGDGVSPVSIQIPKEAGASYSLNFSNHIPVKGMHIPDPSQNNGQHVPLKIT